MHLRLNLSTAFEAAVVFVVTKENINHEYHGLVLVQQVQMESIQY